MFFDTCAQRTDLPAKLLILRQYVTSRYLPREVRKEIMSIDNIGAMKWKFLDALSNSNSYLETLEQLKSKIIKFIQLFTTVFT